MALVRLDADPRPEMVVMAYDAPSGANSFRYRVGWNVNTAGGATSWSGYVQVPGVGHSGEGAGVAFANLDGNPRPEMILMAYDAPSGANSFRYRVGWNVNSHGLASWWSGFVEVGGVGHRGEGAGVAFADLDGNSRPEMILMAYDAPSGANSFRYRVGWNVSSYGYASWWSSTVQVWGVGHRGEGAGVALANLDGNPRPEMILMAYDAPSGANSFRYRIGWNVSSYGYASWWSSTVQVWGVGHRGEGAGATFGFIDSTWRPDMVLMAYDAPSGANNFRYRIDWNVR